MARTTKNDREREENRPPDPESLIPSQQARRLRIVQAALHLLEESPYERIQMRDVADEAGVALGTVYRYFASKEHLFAAVLSEWSEMLSGRVQSRPLRGDTPADKLKDMMSRVLNSFERWPQFFGVVMQLESTPDSHAREEYSRYVARTSNTLAESLDGLAPEVADAVTAVIGAVLSSVVRSWTLGLTTMPEGRHRLMGAIDLVFSPPPEIADVDRR